MVVKTRRPKTRKPKTRSRVKVLKRYQGREITSTIKANTLVELNRMIRGMRAYARSHGLGAVKVLKKAKDPDGGYEAIVQAHNWNPFKWIAKKWEARGGGFEARMKREAEKERRRLRQLELREKREERKRRELLARAKREEAQARLEAAKAKVRGARRKPASRRRRRSVVGVLAKRILQY